MASVSSPALVMGLDAIGSASPATLPATPATMAMITGVFTKAAAVSAIGGVCPLAQRMTTGASTKNTNTTCPRSTTAKR